MARISLIAIAICLGLGGLSLQSRDVQAVSKTEKEPQTTATPSPAPHKHALLVGISDYCRRGAPNYPCPAGGRGRDWWNLDSEPDVIAMKKVLMDKFGFQESDIKVLTAPKETTHKNIVDTFRSFLIDQTVKGRGDVVYFHYSGHGGQVLDDDKHGPNPKVGDELDGLDECLIPSDYVSQEVGSNSIRDDEIEILLNDLKAKEPASVTLSIDSCFSGTITRGSAGRHLVRGDKYRGTLPVTMSTAQTQKDGPSGLFASGAEVPKGFVVISATSPDQVASETTDDATQQEMGLLTYALVKAFSSKDTGPKTTYRDIFEKINDEVTRKERQDPQIEGDEDNILMSGVALKPQPYINVTVEETSRSKKVMLNAGSLQGMTKGSRFSIYPPGADPKSVPPVAEAEIATVLSTTAELKVTPQPTNQMLEQLKTARAVETLHKFGDTRLKVLTADIANLPAGAQIITQLQSLDLLDTSATEKNFDVRICPNHCTNEKPLPGEEGAEFKDGLTLQRQDGSIIARIKNGDKQQEQIVTMLEGEARWQYVKGLKNETDPSLQIKMRLVPVTDVMIDPKTRLAASARRVGVEAKRTEGSRLELHDKQTFMLEIMNTGTEDVFVSVLDLRPDGSIAPLWPHPLIPIGLNENKIPWAADGNPPWVLIPVPFVIKIGAPFGPEVFKAIVTRNRADFSPLFRQADAEEIQRGRKRGTQRGLEEAKSPLGQLIMTGTTGATRGRGKTRGPDDDRLFGAADAANAAAPSKDWATAAINFVAMPE